MPPRKRTKVPCAHCGTIIERKPSELRASKRSFCSMACRAAYQKAQPHAGRVEVACDNCGKVVSKKRSDAAKGKFHYCSGECRYKHQATATKGLNNPHYTERVEVPCAQCGTKLLRTPYLLSTRTNHFCSPKCKAQWQTEHRRGRGNIVTVNQVTWPCNQCGSEFVLAAHLADRGDVHFCSPECKGAWQSANTTGPNHPQWKGGTRNYYGLNWKPQRRKARKRDGCTCQHCGVTEEQIGYELDVHHIIPFREFGIDRYREANHLSNLITLCRACHRQAEAKKILLRPKLV